MQSTKAVALAALYLSFSAPQSWAADGSVNLRAIAPAVCNIKVEGVASSLSVDTVRLGTVRELCNALRGYQVSVSYQPGTLVGATLRLGNDSVILDGSGTAVITDSMGPAVQSRELTLVAATAGFDTSGLDLKISHKS
jgi:hypothetical protein